MELFLRIFSIIFAMFLLITFLIVTAESFKEKDNKAKLFGAAITISTAIVFYYLIKY